MNYIDANFTLVEEEKEKEEDEDCYLEDEEFPGCCGGKVLMEFAYDKDMSKQGKVGYRKWLKKELDHRIQGSKRENYAFITAVTTTEQKFASTIIKGFGFKGTTWMRRPSSNFSPKMKLWYLLLHVARKRKVNKTKKKTKKK